MEEKLISYKQLKKIKPKKFYNSKGLIYWIDTDNKKFYIANKYALPSKKSKIEYNTLHDNKEAVYASIGTEVAFRKKLWFENMTDMKAYFNQEKIKNPSIYYEILQVGYTKLNPEDRKCIFQIPFLEFDLFEAIHTAWKKCRNTNYFPYLIADKWCEIYSSSICENNVDMLRDVICKFMEKRKEILSVDKTIIRIYSENGERYIQFVGYMYHTGSDEDNPYRWVEYKDFIVLFEDVVNIGAKQYEELHMDNFRQYIYDVTEQDYDSLEERYKAHCILYDDIQSNITCGTYCISL